MLQAMNKIDVISSTPGKVVRLSLVVEAGEWEDERRLWWLQEKLNTYAVYALDGYLVQSYPDYAGLPVTIAIVPVEPPPQDVFDFIPRMQAQLGPQGVELTYEPQYRAAA